MYLELVSVGKLEITDHMRFPHFRLPATFKTAISAIIIIIIIIIIITESKLLTFAWNIYVVSVPYYFVGIFANCEETFIWMMQFLIVHVFDTF